jgi:RimJ/RimL family protein N-acetyltransferase
MDVRPVTLEGRHVRLEPLAPAHIDALTPLLEPSLLQWLPRNVTSAAELRSFLREWLDDQKTGRTLPFVTIDRASGRPAGSTCFLAIDRANRRAEIGATWLGREFQRTALNTEAKLLMLGHGFETWQAIRIELKTDSLNQASRAAIARLGAVEEGIFRNHMVTESGRIRHTVWFSITAEEWPQVKQRLTGLLAAGAAA